MQMIPPGSLEPVLVSEDTSNTREEHEDFDVVDQDPSAQVVPEIPQDSAEGQPRLDESVGEVGGDLHEATPEDALPASNTADVPSKGTTPAAKDKPTVPVKPASGKAGSSTLTDKKATLGAGGPKPGLPGKTTTASPSSPLSKTATPPTSKRPTTTSSANSAKTTTMATSRTSGPPPPSRRASMAPPRAPSATGAPPTHKSRTSTLLASFTSAASSKPPADLNLSSRPSVVSPAGSVASLKSNATSSAAVPAVVAPPLRSRTTISEALKRTPSSSRQSLPPAVPPPPQGRTMRPVGSISSIREVRDDAKALEDLQEKLRQANESVSTKSGTVAVLEAKILQLEASLSKVSVDARAKTSMIEQLQSSKQSSDVEVKDLKARLQQLQAERSRDLASLDLAREELENANKSVASQAANTKTLEAQVEGLRADIVAAQENFESLRTSSDQSSAEAAAAAQMEREAFLRAKADVETVTAEANSLRAAHNKALQDVAAKSEELQQRTVDVVALTTQIGEFKGEREESAARISELEVEILELKECQENAEDEHKNTLDRLRRAETELAEAAVATERVLRDVEARDAENTKKTADTASLHANTVHLIQSDLAKAISEIEGLKTELAAAHAAHEETKVATHESAEAREQEMEEAEQSYLSKHIELSEEIKRLTAELNTQEARYVAEVDAVKTEYDERLQEAFERAKNEAGEVHGQDLQVLRAESQATIEQLRAAHQSTVVALEAEHAAALDSHVGSFEKKLNAQSLELRATQDDLSKAKVFLDTSRAENESLQAQLEDVRASFMAASTSADQAAEIDRLTKEIFTLRDESVMLNDVLAATKESLSEMSTNHSKELEEAARVRVEEVMRIHSIHDGELSTLAAQKSELALSLSDLEGEVATLRAQLAAVEPPATPRSNGAVHASTTTVTRDELQKVHEAHNLKMHDLQAEHDRIIRALRMEVETLQTRLDEVQQDVARKSMEIQYLEQEQEESQDSITRLKADLEAVKSATA